MQRSLPLDAAHISAVHPSLSQAIGSLSGNRSSTQRGWPKAASIKAVSPSRSLERASLKGNRRETNASSPSMHDSISAVRPQQSLAQAAAGSIFKIRRSARRFFRSTAEKMSTSSAFDDSAEAAVYFTISNADEVSRRVCAQRDDVFKKQPSDLTGNNFFLLTISRTILSVQ